MRRIDEKDRLKGGVDAKDVDKYLKRFQPDEVAKGIDVEKEHTNSTSIAKEIASDHLGEDPHYYSKLKKVHKESVDVFEFNFHDILEIVWDDEPLSAVYAPKPKEEPKPKEAPKPEPEKKGLEPKFDKIRATRLKDLEGLPQSFIDTQMANFDKELSSIKSKGGRPPTRDKPKNLGVYPQRGRPKGFRPPPRAKKYGFAGGAHQKADLKHSDSTDYSE